MSLLAFKSVMSDTHYRKTFNKHVTKIFSALQLKSLFYISILTMSIMLSACTTKDSEETPEGAVSEVDTLEVDTLIEEMDEFLATATPISNQEFEDKYAKNLTPEEEVAKLRRAHDLVAVAVDPDPDWFSTEVDNSMIVTKQGEEHEITLNKKDFDGNILGPVNNEQLRLVVRVQRFDNEFEYITNVDIDDYAQWVAPGKLKIKVPNDLDQGRLIVGVRPNFDDVAQEAIAERWSTYIMAEVWELKPNVIEVDPAEVLFPIINDKIVSVAAESQFTKAEIASATSKRFTEESSLELPIVLQSNDLKQGDLVAYSLQGKPYSGRVTSLEQRGEQSLALLAPEILEVYEVTDAEDGFLIKEGIFPEHVIYRDGGPLKSNTDESDPTLFASRDSFVDRFVNVDCKFGTPLITLKFKTDITSKDVGIDVKLHLTPDEVGCTWSAIPVEYNIVNGLAASGPGGILLKLFGSEILVSLLGEVQLSAELPAAAGIEFGGSSSEGGYFKFGLKDLINAFSMRDLALSEGSYVPQIKLANSLGIRVELNPVSEDGGIGLVLNFLGVDFGSVGLVAKGGAKLVVSGETPNASTVYNKDSSASVGIEILSFIELALSKETETLFKYIGLEIFKIQQELTILPKMKADVAFTYNKVFDRINESTGITGNAKLSGLSLKSRLLESLSPFDSKGVLGPKNKNSSVFNDLSEDVEYNLSECNEDDGSLGVIKTPAYACSGFLCGKVDKLVELCKGELNITRVVATARVEQTAGALATISNHSPEAVEAFVSASGVKNSLELTHYLTPSEILSAAGGSAEVEFSKECPKQAGVYRGTVKVKGEIGGETVEDTEKSYLVCSKDDFRGDPHIVTADGLGYDYYASGDYILSRIKDVSGYEIQARFLPGHQTSWPQAVSVKIGNDIVEVQGRTITVTGEQMNILRIWVNGEITYYGTHPRSSLFYVLPSGGAIAITRTVTRGSTINPTSVVLIWPEGSQTENYGVVARVNSSGSPFVQLQIARPDTFAGLERGLMGDNDGDPANDFIRRNGQVLGQDTNLSFSELYGLFGTDWLVKPYESLFRNPEAIKPEFPSEVVTLTPTQRDFGEEACQGLTGFYGEACILDVGLSGSVDLVKEYYSNTDDLNSLSESIVTPSIESPRYELKVGEAVQASGSYKSFKQKVDVTLLSGQGKFVLLVRPPKGAAATLSNDHQSYFGEGNFTTEVSVNCDEVVTETNNEFFSRSGALQLWIQDPLSGAATRMVSEEPLICGLVYAGEDIKKTFGEVGEYTQAAIVDGDTLGDLSYSSSNTSIASVQSQTGRVYIKGVGSVTITATLREKSGDLGFCGEISSPRACEILGEDSYILTIDKGNANLVLGDDLVLTNNSAPVTRPVDPTFTDNTVYHSSDTSIATVDEFGKVTLIGAIGEVAITATFSGNDFYLGAEDSYNIDVRQFVEALSSSSEITIQWKSAPNVASYNLYYAAESFSSLPSLNEYSALDEGQLIEGITDASYVLDSLDSEKVYYFILKGVVIGEEGVLTSEINARLLEDSEVKYVFTASEKDLGVNVTEEPENFEPWVTDGSVLGTKKIKELISPGSSISLYNKVMQSFNGNSYFNASSSQDNLLFSRTVVRIGGFVSSTTGLWQTDGTELGTKLVEGLGSKYTSINMNGSFVLPEYLVFSATTLSGSTMLTLDKSGIVTELGHSIESNRAVFDNDFVFNAYSDAADGYVAHQYSNGISSVIEGVGGSYIRDPYLLTNAGGRLFYFTQTGIEDSNKTLWTASKDGGTPLALVEFQSSKFLGSTDFTQQMLSFNSKLYFNAFDDRASLWVSDGTTNGTKLIKIFGTDVVAKEFRVVDDQILFQVVRNGGAANADISDMEGIWSSDGTTEGTVRVKNIQLKSFDAYDTLFNATATNKLYYFISDSNSLWVSDGTGSGTKIIKEASDSTIIKGLVSQKQLVFFEVSEDGYTFNLWRSDGTNGGTFSLGEHFLTDISINE